MEERPQKSASDVALQEEDGPEVIESALWLHYKAVAPYLIEVPETRRQDSAKKVSVEGAAEEEAMMPPDKAA